MARVIHYFAHPGLRHSHTNAAMWRAAQQVTDVTHVDLYADYPHKNIDVATEQRRLVEHDAIVFQFPVFWYSCPALVKDWIDLTLERGFAYGDGGDALHGKTFMLALTTGGSSDAYTAGGYQHYPLRTFLTPFEQTARLCGMKFLAPYVKHGAIGVADDDHIAGFVTLLQALRHETVDVLEAVAADVLTHNTLPISKDTPRHG